METEDEALLRVAQSVANGDPVDWQVEEASHPEAAPRLRRLQAIQKIGDAHLSPIGKKLDQE